MSALNNLRQDVRSVNTPLTDAVMSMEPIILLRNCHPHTRGEHASLLFKEGIITREEASEFVKVIGYVPN